MIGRMRDWGAEKQRETPEQTGWGWWCTADKKQKRREHGKER